MVSLMKPMFDALFQPLNHIGSLEQRVYELSRETWDLRAKSDDLKRSVAAAKRQQLKPAAQVEKWLELVDYLNSAVEELEASFANRRSCLEACDPRILVSDYRLGRRSAELLEQVRELRRRGSFDVVAEPPGLMPVETVPSSSKIVGRDETLAEIRSCLGDDGVGIIGICGMGGVGKTTVLRIINNDLFSEERVDFDMVIWATLSKDWTVTRLRRDIAVRLGLSLPEEERERPQLLFRFLSRIKFLLLLDDVWERLDLVEVGIPFPSRNNKSKIVFTTRSADVCDEMCADRKIEVDVLNEREAWELFQKQVSREVINSPIILPHAKDIVQTCGGLPLPLISIGRSMATKSVAAEWMLASRMLHKSPEEIRGMDQVLYSLKFSWDRLPSEVMKTNLLYCSLFPENCNIDKERLIDYWIGEGLIDSNSENVEEARARGLVNIEHLKAAFLLQAGDDEEDQVKMHSMVRTMALWLVANRTGPVKEFWVAGGLGSYRISDDEWEEARRISLMENHRRHGLEELLHNSRNYPNLLTLLLHRNEEISEIPESFFHCMPFLRVLDLSYTNIKLLPPSIVRLESLQLLDLSNTPVNQLPQELGALQKLRQLNLSSAPHLEEIPRGAILKLTRLFSLNVFDSRSAIRGLTSISDRVSIDDLEGLRQLEELGLTVTEFASLGRLLDSNFLQKAMRFLDVEAQAATSSLLSAASEKLQGLRKLRISHGSELEKLTLVGGELLLLQYLRLYDLPRVEIVWKEVDNGLAAVLLPSLARLEIRRCHMLKDITWVRRLPRLQQLDVSYCDGIEELVAATAAAAAGEEVFELSFPRLKLMNLQHLRKLRSISMHPLPLPSLEYLKVVDCPELKRLPFDTYSGKKMLQIQADREWWEELEWEDESIVRTFQRCFVEQGK